MIITFTGHRDRVAHSEDLRAIAQQHPGAVWRQGGATGFDRQVIAFAKATGQPLETVLPDYGKYKDSPKAAPLIRNRQMLLGADLVVALFDGRQSGGTFQTIQEAKKRNIPVHVLSPV